MLHVRISYQLVEHNNHAYQQECTITGRIDRVPSQESEWTCICVRGIDFII